MAETEDDNKPEELNPEETEALESAEEAEAEEEEEEEEEEKEPEEPGKPEDPDCPKCPGMAPAWMATFADMATLLMAFFVLILSFVEMEDPSIFKEVSGSSTNVFGVQREIPSVEPPIGTNIIAQNFKSSKATPSVNVQEDTTEQDPTDRELKSTEKTSFSDTASDIENLKRTLAKEIAQGKVEVFDENGTLMVTVKGTENDSLTSDEDNDSDQGQVDQDILNLYSKVADAQAVLESPIEVEYDQGPSEESGLKAAEREEQLQDQLQKLKADLRSEIQQGLANVEKVGDQILISLSAQGSFRSGFAELQTGFLPTLRSVGESISTATGKVTISGHTDDVPIAFSDRFDSNWDLSAARAAAVADYFFNTTEIDDQRVSVFGYADTKPVASNQTPQGRSENRRIEILIDG